MNSTEIKSQIDTIKNTFGIDVYYYDVENGIALGSSTPGHRPLYLIAKEIREDWKSVYFGAVPYLDALLRLDQITDQYYSDDADDVVRYFLSNATSWRGETAKRIKAELNTILKGAN